MGDDDYSNYRMHYINPIPKLCGPICQERVEAKFWEDYHSGKFTKVKRNGGTITRVSIDQMKLIRAQKKIEPDLQSDFVKKQMKEEADPMFVRVGGIRCKVLSDEESDKIKKDSLLSGILQNYKPSAAVKEKAEEVKEAKAKWMGEYIDPKSVAKLLSGINWNMEKLQKIKFPAKR